MMSINESREWNSLSDEEQKIIKRHQSCFPVSVSKVAADLGLIVKRSTLSAGISGEIRESDGQYVIKVNRHDSKTRQRFTVAHEIGHFLLHKDRIGDGIVDDILYRSSLSDSLEAQANRIAADILMPADLLNKSLSNASDLKNNALYEHVAKEADISSTALKIRLGKI